MSRGRRERKPGWADKPSVPCRGAELCLDTHLAQAQLLQVLHSDLRAAQSRRCSVAFSGQTLAPLPAALLCPGAVFSPCCREQVAIPLPSPSWLRCAGTGKGSAGMLTSGPAGARLQEPPGTSAAQGVPSDFRGCTAANPHPQTQSSHQPSPGEGRSPELVSHTLFLFLFAL